MTRDTPENKQWLHDVISALRAYDGNKATLHEVYRWIENNRTSLPPKWKESVRATIYQHSKDSPAYRRENFNFFYSAGRRGLWGLRDGVEDELTAYFVARLKSKGNLP